MEDRVELPTGYRWRQGTPQDRAALLEFARAAYSELYPSEAHFSQLGATIESCFLPTTPLWWVDRHCSRNRSERGAQPSIVVETVETAGLLWLGSAVEPASGERYGQVLLLYVCPTSRRLGIGTALMRRAELAARARGDRCLDLQVLAHNQPALSLYEKLGYQPRTVQLTRELCS